MKTTPASHPDGPPADVEPFAFESMEAFQLALEMADLADDIAISQRAARPWLASQLGSASLSILNNTAEGIGEYSSGDKSRFFRYALRSAVETAAMIILLGRKALITLATEVRNRKLLLRLVKTLTRMAIHNQRKKRRKTR